VSTPRVPLLTIPSPLPRFSQWVTYREVPDGKGKPTKVPYIAGTNQRASTTDPATWTSLENALALKNGDAGIGFVLTLDAGIVGIDIDGCRNPLTGEITTWGKRIVERLRTYTEISPSGEGLHLFVNGVLPAGARKSGSLEMYASGRFFTVTGDRLDGAPDTIEQGDVAWLHRLLAARVFDFAKNPKLENLLNGDASSYPSQSEADLALCSLLARLGLPEADIDSAFRLSALFREKWTEARGDSTYGRDTIRTALESGNAKSFRKQPSPQLASGGDKDVLLRTESGTLRPILQNAVVKLSGYPKYADLRFSEFTSRATLNGRAWTDADDSELACQFQCDGLFVSSALAAEAAQLVARSRPFHEVREYLRSLRWDGKARLENLLTTYFGAALTEFVKAVGVRFLVSACARVMCPGCQCDHVLLLLGKQGTGKSSGLRALFGPEWFSDHAPILGSKDSFVELMGKWCVEWAELTAMRRADTEAVKAFLTAPVDTFRPPYGRRAADFPRQNVFCGTSNDETPFVDPTGNRRFWPIPTGAIAVGRIAADRDALWAEAYSRYQTGAPWWLSPSEEKLAANEQEARYEPGPWDEAITAWIVLAQRRVPKSQYEEVPWYGSQPGKVNVSDVLIHAVGKTLAEIKLADQMAVGRCLRHLGWTMKQEGSGPFRGRRYYYRPEGDIR
jgi:hypothetical protein